MSRLVRDWFLVTVVFLLGGGLAPAVRAQISADRPGVADGTATVAGGRLQAALGYAYSGGSFYSHEFGQLFVRYGIADGFEIRTGINSFVVNQSSRDDGYNGSSLGAKVRLFETGDAALSGVATLGLSTEAGGLAARDDRARQEFTVAAGVQATRELTAAVNVGTRFYYASGTQDDRDVRGLVIPTLSYQSQTLPASTLEPPDSMTTVPTPNGLRPAVPVCTGKTRSST